MNRLFSSTNIVALLLMTFTIVFATDIDNALQYRQNIPKGTGSSASAAVTSTATSVISSDSPIPTLFSSSTSESSSTSISKSNDIPPDTSSSSSSSDASPSSTSVVSSQATPSSTTSSDGSDTSLLSTPTTTSASSTNGISSNDGTSSGPTQVITSTHILVSSKTLEYETAVVTVSGSSTFTHIVATSGLQAVSTSTTTSKSTPGLGENESSSGGPGLQHPQKMVIIGTVVGIGGALLLGGVGLVAWRIWSKKRHHLDEDHDLMGLQPGSSSHEKRSSISGTSPFRSTLDQYHNPAGPVNTASNF